jgi:hypothetical protein
MSSNVRSSNWNPENETEKLAATSEWPTFSAITIPPVSLAGDFRLTPHASIPILVFSASAAPKLALECHH